MSDLLDGVTRHQIFVQRYAAGREREAAAFIERTINTVNSRLASDITDFSRGRLEAVLFDLEQYSKESLAALSTLTVQESLKFAEYEVGFNERLLGQNISVNLTVPAPNQVSSAIFSSVMQVEPKQGYSIQQALRMFEGKKSAQIVDTIRSGIIIGDTRQQITSSLMQLKGLQKQQAATLTRTITNHVSTESRMLFMKENEELLEGYEWVSTLDSKTSLVCASRDGTVYPFTDDPIRSPKPPAHFSCRSTVVPKVNPEFDLAGGRVGVRPSIGPDGVEIVSGSTTYEGWLKRQPKDFQDEVLGKERGKLFREGGMSLDRFVDMNGNTISLKRLKELEPITLGKPVIIAPPVVPVAQPVAPVPAQSFKYDSFRPVKNWQEADSFMVNNGIAEMSSLKGLSIEGINAILPAAQESVERFNLAPLAGFGPSSRFGLRQVRGAGAAIFPKSKVFHAPTKLGSAKSIQEQQKSSDSWGIERYEKAKAAIEKNSYAHPDVKSTFKTLRPESIKFTYGNTLEASKRTANTVYHEYGHVLHLIDKQVADEIDNFIRIEQPMQRGWPNLISTYAGTNSKEYVAEAFSVYMSTPLEHYRIHPRLLSIFQKVDRKK